MCLPKNGCFLISSAPLAPNRRVGSRVSRPVRMLRASVPISGPKSRGSSRIFLFKSLKLEVLRPTNLPYLYIASVFSDGRSVNSRGDRRNTSTNRHRKAEDPTTSRRATRLKSTSRLSYLCAKVFIQVTGKRRECSYYSPEHLKSQVRGIQEFHKRCWSSQSLSCSIYITRNRTRRCGLYSREGCFLASNHCHFQKV